MKVILKGGSDEKNEEMKNFFMEKIFPILNFGIAFEPSDRVITVIEKKDGENIEYVDPTAEVIVELTEEARNLAKSEDVSKKQNSIQLKQKSGEFFDEAMAIVKIEKLRPSFSVEYYSCRYTPPPEAKTVRPLPKDYKSVLIAPEKKELSVIWGNTEDPEHGTALRIGDKWFTSCETPVGWHPAQSEGL